jgi:hypothetical protein
MIIGLVGFKQVGKSTAAKHLEGRGFKRHNFKDALVKELRENFPELLREIADAEMARKFMLLDEGETMLQVVDRLFEEKPPLMRALMQNYGTDVRRKDNDNYWVEQWLHDGKNLDHIVADDVRFHNEADAVKGQGGILIRLTRPDILTGGTHSSETEQLEIVADHTIECEPGDHGKLFQALDKIILPPENWMPND